MKHRQSGSSLIALILVIIVLGVASYTAFRVYQAQTGKITAASAEEKAAKSEVKIKHIGFNLDYYNPQTNMAGDIRFTKFAWPEGSFGAIFSEYDRPDVVNTAKGAAGGSNPQPTFLLPLGTKIHALIDGEVVKVPKLYSGDYSVHMQGEGSDLVFETEHVINVNVKVGDKVKAGDIIAEVSNYNGDRLDGMGLVELGVLITGKTPGHACTFDYLDDSIKTETLKKLRALEDSWESYRGEPNAYQQDKEVIPGCLSRNIIYDNHTGGGK